MSIALIPGKKIPIRPFFQKSFHASENQHHRIKSRKIAYFVPDFAIIITATRKSPAASTVANHPIRVAIPEAPPEIRHDQSLSPASWSQNTVMLTSITNTISHRTTKSRTHSETAHKRSQGALDRTLTPVRRVMR